MLLNEQLCKISICALKVTDTVLKSFKPVGIIHSSIHRTFTNPITVARMVIHDHYML